MPQHRRTVWLVIATLVATFCFAAPSAQPVLGGTGDARCTNQTDALHPPQYIRVQRLAGGADGRVEEVPFWSYVGTVLRGEYGTGVRRSPHWLRVGAIVVKQYAWYYVVKWRGAKNAAGQCFHVKDTTADQMYKPETYTPNATTLAAMRDTWHIAMRKWIPDKGLSQFFLSGYRTGARNVPCGHDAIGHRIFQKSLRDCENKNLVLEEMLRKYFEPNLQIIDNRGHDAIDDNGAYNGDLVTLTSAGLATTWRTLAGGNGSLANGQNGTFNMEVADVLGQGVGNVDVTRNNMTEALADVILLVDNNGQREVRIHRATGNGFSQTPDTYAVGGNVSRLLVADFNGDMRVDAGLVEQNGSQVTVKVILINRWTPDGLPGPLWTAPTEWWSGELDLSSAALLAGDTNGDAKADLVVRRASGEFAVADSEPSCQPYSVWGACPTGSIGEQQLGSLESAGGTTTAPQGSKLAMTDFNRDGRDDVVVIGHNGSNNVTTVYGLRGKSDGTLMDAIQLWQGTTPFAFQDMQVVGMHVNSDSLGDLVLVPPKADVASKPVWLRASEQSKTNGPAMTLVPSSAELSWSPADRAF